MKRITVIGGGASGTLLAINLLRNAAGRPIEVNLVERQPKIGRGVAFGTVYDTHLLNVPAGRMGAFPDALKGLLWETTAILGIRGQARDLALRLLAD